MKKSYFIFYFLLLPTFFFTPNTYTKTRPKLTIVFVIDQFGYNYVKTMGSHFKKGLKTILKDGTFYSNAYHPHGIPATATGHAALSTGVYAKDHGIIGNKWFDAEGEKINCDDDTPENAAVFGPNGLYDYGKSSVQMITDSVSDQFALASTKKIPRHTLALSLKSRAAITMGNKLGKAIWFDEQAGQFTSSKAYFNQLPAWLTAFNKKYHPSVYLPFHWKPLYSKDNAAYKTHDPAAYQYSKTGKPLIHSAITKDSSGPPYKTFMHTPLANQLLCDLAQTCVDQYTSKKLPDRLLLWVSLSSLDKVGHDYGLESLEAHDMVYQLDAQIGALMQYTQKKLGKNNVLFCLTADHGVSPMVERMRKRGYANAQRILYQDIIATVNEHTQNKYGITDLVARIKTPQLFINEQALPVTEHVTREEILQDIALAIQNHPGIKNAWTYDQLANTYYTPGSLESYFKNQLFPGRSGAITVQTHPYAMMTKNKTGTGHKTPYEYDTHVPMAFYQSGSIDRKKIDEKVWSLQFANTLAYLLGVHKPSASTMNPLPGIMGKK